MEQPDKPTAQIFDFVQEKAKRPQPLPQGIVDWWRIEQADEDFLRLIDKFVEGPPR